MKDRLIRLCSLVLVLALTAGWLLFGRWSLFMTPRRAEATKVTEVASGSYHFAPMPDAPASRGATACIRCHGRYPHEGNDFSGAFLNFHDARLDCMACHLERKRGREARLAWFESTPAGLIESSGDNMKAFLAPYADGPDGREIFEGRSNGPAAEVSEKGKHLLDFDKPSCSACHSNKGLARLADAGYTGEALARLNRLDRITRFTKGEVFYYPRF